MQPAAAARRDAREGGAGTSGAALQTSRFAFPSGITKSFECHDGKRKGERSEPWLTLHSLLQGRSGNMLSSMLDEATIERMTPAEQRIAMEMLWRALSRTPADVSSPDWHEPVVAERLKHIEEGKGQFLTVNEVKSWLRERKG